MKSTNEIINELENLNINYNTKKFYSLEEDKVFGTNKEMFELKYIYETMRRALIIRQAFEKENYLERHHLEFLNLIQNINLDNVKGICNSFIGFYHFKNESYNLAENEFLETLIFIKESEIKLINGKDKKFEEKIKDEIKRSSSSSYVNVSKKAISKFVNIIRLKIFRQRFLYLYAMTKFKLGNEINTSSANNNMNVGTNVYNQIPNKNKIKKDKDKKINLYKDAIKYFKKCKNINISLGINQIKIIYSLIMISIYH